MKLFRWFRQGQARYLEGREPLDIRRLVSPLRYDVLVRKGFFELLEAERTLYEADFDGFVRLAEADPYAVWFDRVLCWRARRDLIENPGRRREAFRDRVRRSAELYFSVQRHGLRPGGAITLRAGREVLPADSGKAVSAAIFPGDGCHRLALLLLEGRTLLEPWMYRVDLMPAHAPRDNTALLLGGLSLTEAEYAAFLSWGYCREEHRNLASVVREVEMRDPERLGEVRAVIAADLPHLRGRSLPSSGGAP